MRAPILAVSACFTVSVAAAATVDLNAPHVPGELLARAWSWADPDGVSDALADNDAVVLSVNNVLNFMKLGVNETSSITVIDNLEGSGLFQFVERNYYATPGDGPAPPAHNPEPSTFLMFGTGVAALIQLVNRKAR